MTPDYLSLSDQALEALGISSLEIVDALEEALLRLFRGDIRSAPKSAIIPGDGRYLMTTLSTSEDPAVNVVKSVMVAPDNPSKGFPAIEGAIILHDSATGHLKAVMQSGWVTAVRTAGLSAVAARKLANPQSGSIAFIGCGVQARSHLNIFADLFPLTGIRTFGRGQANIDRLCDLAGSKGLMAHQCASPQEAIEGADLIVTSVTLSFDLEPFLDPRWMKPGAFASITDAGTPWFKEPMGEWGTIIVDDREQEAASSNKMVDPVLVQADLTELVAKNEPHYDSQKSAAFLFRGLAIGDFAISALAYERAKANGLGQPVSWD